MIGAKGGKFGALNVAVLPEYAVILREKQGGSKKRAEKLWADSYVSVSDLLKNVEKRDKFFILAALYWGEGVKKEFNVINSDPALIKVLISCLDEIGVKKRDLRISLRLYNGINIDAAKNFWAKICSVKKQDILNVVLEGKKTGKLPYGMCRIRISRGGEYFKLIMNMIKFIKAETINN